MAPIRYRTADVGFKVFYREAGPADAPKLLLLHGFPSAGHMFRDLIPLLADSFHIVAPDLPGLRPVRHAAAREVQLHIRQYRRGHRPLYRGHRLRSRLRSTSSTTARRPASGSPSKHPERITAIISQNGNAYEEGLSDGWNPIRAYWQDPSQANREALRAFLTPETTRWQYTHGVPDPTMVSPDGYSLDNFYLARPGADEIQLDLFGDYKSNVALYPDIPEIFPHAQAAVSGGLGQERSVLPAAGRRGVQARQSRTRSCASSIPATSRWKRMPARSPKASAIS